MDAVASLLQLMLSLLPAESKTCSSSSSSSQVRCSSSLFFFSFLCFFFFFFFLSFSTSPTRLASFIFFPYFTNRLGPESEVTNRLGPELGLGLLSFNFFPCFYKFYRHCPDSGLALDESGLESIFLNPCFEVLLHLPNKVF